MFATQPVYNAAWAAHALRYCFAKSIILLHLLLQLWMMGSLEIENEFYFRICLFM